MEIINGKIKTNELTKNAQGGSELYGAELIKYVDNDLLKNFQIVFGRARELDQTKKRIFFCNDLPEDPESQILANGGWNKFDKLVFVSNWQMQRYIQTFGMPWRNCTVVKAAIEPISIVYDNKPKDKIKLIYHTTPHRGLQILVPVFEKLSQEFNNLELDVFSSFNAYGWPERDEIYKDLFKVCEDHPKINYYGFQPLEKIRESVSAAHIFAYPCIWLETACRSLMESMSGELISVHPNYGALYETAANWSLSYQWVQDLRDHAEIFYNNLRLSIKIIQESHENPVIFEQLKARIMMQKIYADQFYSWDTRKVEWEELLKNM